MKSTTNLLTTYLTNSTHPTFKNFVNQNREEIQDLSTKFVTIESAKLLEKKWISLYNEAIAGLRPQKPLMPMKSKKEMPVFVEIFSGVQKRLEEEEEKDDDDEEDEDEDKNEDEEEEEEDDEEEDDEEEEEEQQQQQKPKLALAMQQRFQGLSLPQSYFTKELEKLINSSCITVVNNRYTDLYRKVTPSSIMDNILVHCGSRRTSFNDSCHSGTKKLIFEVFEELKKYEFDDDVSGALHFIDSEKASILNKSSEKYILLSLLSHVINNFRTYKDEEEMSEAAHLRKFANILDILLLATTSITFFEGETVSRSTKKMKTMTCDEADFGRRIDMLVKTEKTNEERYDLCSNEFKKTSVGVETLNHQQSKNTRINACILNDINLLLGDDNASIFYFDFSGRHAYITELFNFAGCFVAHKIGDFLIPKSLLQLDDFRSSLIDLYSWKASTIITSKKVQKQLLKEEDRYDLADVSGITSPHRQHITEHVNVVFTPTKNGKRSFEE